MNRCIAAVLPPTFFTYATPTGDKIASATRLFL